MRLRASVGSVLSVAVLPRMLSHRRCCLRPAPRMRVLWRVAPPEWVACPMMQSCAACLRPVQTFDAKCHCGGRLRLSKQGDLFGRRKPWIN